MLPLNLCKHHLADHVYSFFLQKESLLNSPGKLSRLRCLQLVMGLGVQNIDKLSRVVSILRAAPLIEKLEINVSTFFLTIM
jgi:hypothetical protein